MKVKHKIQKLKQAFEKTIWMSIRYANGKRTYEPGVVRGDISDFKSVFPEWMPEEELTINPPTKKDLEGLSPEGDYLHDLLACDDSTRYKRILDKLGINANEMARTIGLSESSYKRMTAKSHSTPKWVKSVIAVHGRMQEQNAFMRAEIEFLRVENERLINKNKKDNQ